MGAHPGGAGAADGRRSETLITDWRNGSRPFLQSHNQGQILTDVSRREFAITETDDNAIAAAAIIGDRRSPVIG